MFDHGRIATVADIDFTANLERSVELTFRPNAAIRVLEKNEFCVGGPQITPHIVAQQLLQPGERRTITIPLEAGRYRVRTMTLAGGARVEPFRPGERLYRRRRWRRRQDDWRRRDGGVHTPGERAPRDDARPGSPGGSHRRVSPVVVESRPALRCRASP